MNWRWLAAAAALLLVLTGWLGWKLYPASHLPSLGPTVTAFERGPVLSPFRIDSTVGPFTEASLQGRWTFLLFGYTHCPDVCPTHLALLSGVMKHLAGAERPHVVFVSVDPSRDRLDVLQRYVPAFDPTFIGATGSDAALKPLVQSLSAYYVRNAPERGSESYSVDHSSTIFLIAPDGRLKAAFQDPLESRMMARDTLALLGR